MTSTNTPIASATPKKMIRWKSVRPLGPRTPFATSATERPFERTDTTSAEKSCTHPTRIAPSTTHASAGPQPQMTATAGPSIGARPVIDAKWCPKSIAGRLGT